MNGQHILLPQFSSIINLINDITSNIMRLTEMYDNFMKYKNLILEKTKKILTESRDFKKEIRNADGKLKIIDPIGQISKGQLAPAEVLEWMWIFSIPEAPVEKRRMYELIGAVLSGRMSSLEWVVRQIIELQKGRESRYAD